MIEPAFSFTIPSLHDDLSLDCRIYHPKDFGVTLSHVNGKSQALRGAVIAHPYAPLGGSFDDPVVLAVARCLLREGFVVGTFNFRGATGSKGSTSWTGRAEREDYAAFAGFVVYYLSRLQAPDNPGKLDTIYSQIGDDATSSPGSGPGITLLLAGYSYGSLILSRLPALSTIIQRFESSERGTSAAEIVLRARRLARETEEMLAVAPQTPLSSSRGRRLEPSSLSPTKQRIMRPSPVIVGGEETDPADRRRSRESRRSLDVVRRSVEAPKRIAAHIRRRSSGPADDATHPAAAKTTLPALADAAPRVEVRYLLISPVLPPLSHALASPAVFSTLFSSSRAAFDKSTGVGALRDPTLVLWGSSDSFTSGRRLRSWAERLAVQAPGRFTWKEFDRVGHVWREEGALKSMVEAIGNWVRAESSV